jgi:predicted nucleic acid-binding protein
MRATVVVDASVGISIFVPHDVHHRPSRRWLDRWLEDGNRVTTPILALSEVSGAVARRTQASSRGHRAAARLRRVPILRLDPLDDLLGEEAAKLAADLQLRGANAVYLALAMHLSIPLVTWDQEQLTRGAAVVQTRVP